MAILKSKYKVVLDLLSEKHVQKANNIEQALMNMKIKWSSIKSKGTLTIYKGNKKHEHLFTSGRLRLIFGNKLTRKVWCKNLDYFLKEGPDSNIPEVQKFKDI